MPAQYICTTNVEQAISFYTAVVGLRYLPQQHEAALSSSVDEGGSGAARRPQVLVIKGDTLAMAPSRHASRLRRTLLRRFPGSLAQDLYFLSRYPLDYVKARVLAAGWEGLQGPVTRQGSTHVMRVLYMLDPDGNRIRLVELAA